MGATGWQRILFDFDNEKNFIFLNEKKKKKKTKISSASSSYHHHHLHHHQQQHQRQPHNRGQTILIYGFSIVGYTQHNLYVLLRREMRNNYDD